MEIDAEHIYSSVWVEHLFSSACRTYEFFYIIFHIHNTLTNVSCIAALFGYGKWCRTYVFFCSMYSCTIWVWKLMQNIYILLHAEYSYSSTFLYFVILYSCMVLHAEYMTCSALHLYFNFFSFYSARIISSGRIFQAEYIYKVNVLHKKRIGLLLFCVILLNAFHIGCTVIILVLYLSSVFDFVLLWWKEF